MMVAKLVEVADAVVARLNGSPFSLPFTAARVYDVTLDLAALATLRVNVAPRTWTSTPLDRSRQSNDIVIDVGVQKRVNPIPEECDPLVGLVEEMADNFLKEPHLDAVGVRCTETAIDPVYLPDHLRESRVFTSVLSLTFQEWRDRR